MAAGRGLRLRTSDRSRTKPGCCTSSAPESRTSSTPSCACKGTRPCAFGALDTVRVTSVYVSGSQFRSVASTSYAPGRRRGLPLRHGAQQGRPAPPHPVLLRPQAVREAPSGDRAKTILGKLYTTLHAHQCKGARLHSYGALDAVQVIAVYVSSSHFSSTASTSIDSGPDVADYLYDMAPNEINQLFRAQFFFHRKQYEERHRMPREDRAKTISNKLSTMLRARQCKSIRPYPFGALNILQVVQATSVYVSGSHISATASASFDLGPDVEATSYDTAPNKVDQLFHAQFFYTRKQYEECHRMSPEQEALIRVLRLALSRFA
eukprot:CAMPEP_0203955018 /NCGR_PEP_ID=MMETSP0359-20131031/87799_1 /ASSEMBLY_ACC=CAM_ASM_000338 /TAXON_ID=268821 /ORGANISM="Scrippsiella Hangoei, Strain SHTV-5" /LENGTH=320 /DNA_ID=CAMNT_0050888593 /DNA_START=60 /DNA_END=1023 /DNA_ORIENTATION=+